MTRRIAEIHAWTSAAASGQLIVVVAIRQPGGVPGIAHRLVAVVVAAGVTDAV